MDWSIIPNCPKPVQIAAVYSGTWITRRLFLLLDGTRTRKDLVATLWPGVPEAESMRELDAALAHLARLALLVR
jgi:hypothetical protein